MATIKVVKLDERAIVPAYAHKGDACADLAVLIDNGEYAPFLFGDGIGTKKPLKVFEEQGKFATIINPLETAIFHTGLKMSTEAGWFVKIHTRSSVGIKRNLMLSNTTGIIDTKTYRGEILVAIRNLDKVAQTIITGERLGQIELAKVHPVTIEVVENLDLTSRGEGGIGSTGK